MAKQVDAQKIIQAARHSIPVTIKTYTLPHETELYLENILEVFLRELGQEAIKDPLAYCLRELAVNAKKANTKRVFFTERKLDLEDEDDYSEGMKAFKEETLDNIEHYLNLQKDAGFYIRIVFHVKNGVLTLAVCNNAVITKKEQIRVFDRIARSRAFETLEEALTTVLDDSEGAGLGIVILVLMLKKLGLSEDAFDIDVDNGETVARVTIPMSKVKSENILTLSKQLVDEVESLPQFPENIVGLQRMLSSEDSEIADIARQVSTDPALTADLLKVVNSAQFMLPKKVDNIVEAVKLVGLRGLKNLLYTYGTQKILGSNGEEQKRLWEHSSRTAYYSYSIAKNISRKKDILDDVYVGGILHDMGKIVFSNIHPDLLEKITLFCKTKDIPQELMEDIYGGLNHSEIGSMIAKKWNFPSSLVEAIKHHHTPLSSQVKHRDVVFTVYLANAFAMYEAELLSWEQMEHKVLSHFNIKDEEQFRRILEKLSEAYYREERKST